MNVTMEDEKRFLVIENCLKAGDRFLHKGEDGRSILDEALEFEEPEVIHLMLKYCDLSELDIHDPSHREFLNLAVEMGEEGFLCRWQSERGSIYDMKDENGRGPLHQASACGAPGTSSWKSVAYFLRQGVDPDVRDNDNVTPLHYIGNHITEDEVQEFTSKIFLLIRGGADVNARDFYNRTPLHYCKKFKKGGNCIFDLLRFGADINAVDNGNENVVDYLVKTLEREGYMAGDFNTREPMNGEIEFYEATRILFEHYFYLSSLNLPITSAVKCSSTRLGAWLHMFETRVNHNIFSKKYIRDKLSTGLMGNLPAEVKAEKDKLENIKLYNGISLYEVISASHHQMSILLKKHAFKKYFEEHKYQEDFPRMWYFLEIQYYAGLLRNTLNPYARDAIRSLQLPLPDLCLELILEFFSNQELKDFIKIVDASGIVKHVSTDEYKDEASASTKNEGEGCEDEGSLPPSKKNMSII